jgi:6-phosphogluconolactonase
MPLAVSPDKRLLVAAVRAQPFPAHSYRTDAASGALSPLGTGELAASFPYIVFDRTGRWLLAASYHQNLVAVHPVREDGRIGTAAQVIPTARNAHAICTDLSNRYVFVPHLGTDQVFQFRFDAASGRLASNTPPLVQLERGCGPRHLVVSADNRFVYVLTELTAQVITLALDAGSGLLRQVSAASALSAQSKLLPGQARLPTDAPHDRSNDIWASDVHLTPDGRHLYAAERTTSVISALRVDPATGNLTYLGSTPTEKQPRGFAIDPSGRYLVASGEKSEMLASYAIDGASGALRPVGRYPAGKGGNWVEIL